MQACAGTSWPAMPISSTQTGGRPCRKDLPEASCPKCCPIPTACASRATRAADDVDSALLCAFAQAACDVLRLNGRARIALFRRGHVPIERFPQVLRHTVAVLVEASDDVLRAGVAVLRCSLVPLRSELPVLGRSASEKVLRGELDLSLGVALIRGLVPPLGRGCQRTSYTNPAFV